MADNSRDTNKYSQSGQMDTSQDIGDVEIAESSRRASSKPTRYINSAGKLKLSKEF